MKNHYLKITSLAAPVVAALLLSSCVGVVGVPVAQSSYPVATGYGVYTTLPVGYRGSAYYYNDRYYYGGRYETGNYSYQGRPYNDRYFYNGNYFYGGRHQDHDGRGPNQGPHQNVNYRNTGPVNQNPRYNNGRRINPNVPNLPAPGLPTNYQPYSR